MGKCSLMFAYVRLCSLYWRKMFEAPDGERSSILQNARQTELGTRGTRPSEYQRQGLARTCLDLGRARWMREKADRMNGKAKNLSDRNTCFICDSDERGSGIRENLRLFSLIWADSTSRGCGRSSPGGPGIAATYSRSSYCAHTSERVRPSLEVCGNGGTSQFAFAHESPGPALRRL